MESFDLWSLADFWCPPIEGNYCLEKSVGQASSYIRAHVHVVSPPSFHCLLSRISFLTRRRSQFPRQWRKCQLWWRRRCSTVHLLLYQVLLRLWGFRVCIHTFFCIHYTYALRVIHQEHVYFKLSCFLNLLLIFFAALYGYGALDQSWSRLVSGCYRTPSDVIDGSIRLASIWQCVSLLATMYRGT